MKWSRKNDDGPFADHEQKHLDKSYAKKVPWWLLGLKFAFTWANGKRKDAVLVKKAATAAVAAVTGVGVVAAGAVGYQRFEDLSGRVDAVEDRPVLDLGPIRATTDELSQRVDGLHESTVDLIRRLDSRGRDLDTVAKDAGALAEDARETSVDIANLSGQVQATADAADGTDKDLAEQLAALADSTAASTRALSDQIAGLEAALVDVGKKTEVHSVMLAEVEASLDSMSAGLEALQEQVAAINAQLVDLDKRIADVGERANSAQKAAGAAQDDVDALGKRVDEMENTQPGEEWAGIRTADSQANVFVQFPEAFDNTPVVVCTVVGPYGNRHLATVVLISVSTTGFNAHAHYATGNNGNGTWQDYTGATVHCLAKAA